MKASSRLFLVVLFFVCTLSVGAQQIPPTTNAAVGVPQGALIPKWLAVVAFTSEPGLSAITSRDVQVLHGRAPSDGFIVLVRGNTFAAGCGPRMVGYVSGAEMRWIDLSANPLRYKIVVSNDNELRVDYQCSDRDGATWQVKERFQAEVPHGAIQVQIEISVDQERAVAFLPMLLLFPGAGSFGSEKGQGLFAGLEYLENEPSSSEADLVGQASKRQVPDSLKITFPLMAIQAQGSYLSLAWQMRPYISAIFDSPDRLFQSGGHVMGLLFPGSNGKSREEGKLLPRFTQTLRPGQPVQLQATILGGPGTSIVPAIQHFVQCRALPDLPNGPGLAAYVNLAAGGWLDSKIRETNLFRHALAGSGFPPQPAADAAIWMHWLADQGRDAGQSARLRVTATNVVSAVPGENLNFAGVGHVRYPVESLVFGWVAQNSDHARQAGHALLANFEPDGSAKYRPKSGGQDFARTHWTNEASGFASHLVVDLLQDAAFSGDRDLLKVALEKLHALDKFHDGVPRGAQTWECPLHTPDILASAQMVRAYTLGFELTGENHLLQEARYWAWTGLPFVYLVNPTEQPIGLYSTIAVFGATQWKAPVWLGLPVQWCGLVYADALYRLARHDPQGIWKKVADGITISGMQQSWPPEDDHYKGLLPDSFVLREQKRNGPAINPATLEACASQYFGSRVYDFRCFRVNGLLVHAPGEIVDDEDSKGHISFQVRTRISHPYFVLINCLPDQPRVKINGRAVECASPHQFLQKQGQLILQLEGVASFALDF